MSTISPIERNTWDNNVIVTRDGAVDATWDGKVKMLVYDTGSMTWIAYTPVGGVGGGGDASAANQTTEIARLTSIRDSLAGTLAVNVGLTDAQLRAAAVPVSGPLTDTQIRASALPVSGPITDTQIRASALPVSIASMPSTPVTGPLTDTQMRATAVPISAAALPLPSGAATEATLATIPVAQGATLGTNKQVLQGAAVSASAPSYTDGVISPVSMTLAGKLRVDTEIELRRAIETQQLASLLNNQNAILALEQGSVGHYGFELR